MKPRSITFRGGLRAGALNLSWPFVTLRLEPEALVIEAAGQRHYLRKEDVVSLGMHRGIFSSGISISHAIEGLGSPAIFWSFAPRSVLATAEKLGFKISEPTS